MQDSGEDKMEMEAEEEEKMGNNKSNKPTN